MPKNKMTKITFAVFFLLFCSLTDAFVTQQRCTPFVVTHRHHAPLMAKGDEDSGGGAAIAKPQIKTDIKTKTVQKEKVHVKKRAQTSDPVSRREEDFEDAPMFKLMLLGDEGYDSTHVIERMCAVIEDLDEDAAATVFQQANQEGKAMCGKYPFERAELFKEQLIRSDPMIFSDLEEENK